MRTRHFYRIPFPIFLFWGNAAFAGEWIPSSTPASDAMEPSEPMVLASNMPIGAEEALRAGVNAVLARHYDDLDTAALMQALRQRAEWGESDSRFVEAEAVLHFDQGQWTLALPLLRRLNRPSPQALSLLADCMQYKGDRYEAATLRLRAARGLPIQDPNRAALFLRYLDIYPDSIQVKLEMADALGHSNQPDEAARFFLQIENHWIRDTTRIYQVAEYLQTTGRLGDLEGLLRRARLAFPDLEALTRRHATLLETLGEKQKAAQAWMLIWKMHGDSSAIGKHAVDLVTDGGNKDSLRATLEQAIRIDSSHAEWHVQLAETCLKLADPACAYREMAALVKAQPRNRGYVALLNQINATLTSLASAAALHEKNSQDLSALRLEAEANPTNSLGWVKLGNALALLPDLKAAAEPLQKAIDLGSQEKEVFINRARAYREVGDTAMARSILTYLLAENSDDYLVLIWSARFAKMDGDLTLANSLYKKASKIGPAHEGRSDLASLAMKDSGKSSEP